MSYKISLSTVRVPEESRELVIQALSKGMIGQCELIEQFEQVLAGYTGAKYCVAIGNGTMADAVLVAAMKELYGIKRVVVPALTFIAHPNSVRYNNLPVVFADVGDDWIMQDPPEEESVYSMHDTLLFPADLMGRVRHWDANNRLVITDACESFGSTLYGKKSGTMTLAGTYSFFPSHTISTGEGGAIVTDNYEIAGLCRLIRAHGSASSDPMERFTFPHYGFNARMTCLQAALGIGLMKHIDEYIETRDFVFGLMNSHFKSFKLRKGEFVVPHAYPIEFESERLRDSAMRTLLASGVEVRKFFSCIPLDEGQYSGHQTGSFPVASHISRTHLYLPCHQNMNADDVTEIIKMVDPLPGRVWHGNL